MTARNIFVLNKFQYTDNETIVEYLIPKKEAQQNVSGCGSVIL